MNCSIWWESRCQVALKLPRKGDPESVLRLSAFHGNCILTFRACDRTTFTVHVSGHIFRECAQLILKNTAVKDVRNQHDPLILTLPPQLRVDSSRRGLRPLSGHRVRTTWRRAPEDCVLLKKVDSKKIVCDLFVLISKRTKYLFLKEPFGKRFRRRKQSLANPI